MEKNRIRYVKPSMEMIETEPVMLLEESMLFFEDEITDPTEIE